jgi:hypothetical protein
MPPPFGSTFEDVRALLPHRRFAAGSKPDQADVEGYLESVGAVLDVNLEPAPADPVKAARLTALSKRAVVYGAAAQAEAAAAPERANPNDASSYAQWLLGRYQEAVADAEGYYAELRAIDEPGVEEATSVAPAWSFPEPVGWADRGI